MARLAHSLLSFPWRSAQIVPFKLRNVLSTGSRGCFPTKMTPWVCIVSHALGASRQQKWFTANIALEEMLGRSFRRRNFCPCIMRRIFITVSINGCSSVLGNNSISIFLSSQQKAIFSGRMQTIQMRKGFVICHLSRRFTQSALEEAQGVARPFIQAIVHKCICIILRNVGTTATFPCCELHGSHFAAKYFRYISRVSCPLTSWVISMDCPIFTLNCFRFPWSYCSNPTGTIKAPD